MLLHSLLPLLGAYHHLQVGGGVCGARLGHHGAPTAWRRRCSGSARLDGGVGLETAAVLAYATFSDGTVLAGVGTVICARGSGEGAGVDGRARKRSTHDVSSCTNNADAARKVNTKEEHNMHEVR